MAHWVSMEDLTRKGGLCLFLVNDKSYAVLRKSTSFGTWALYLGFIPGFVIFFGLWPWVSCFTSLSLSFLFSGGEWVPICWIVWRTGEEVEHEALPKYESFLPKRGWGFQVIGKYNLWGQTRSDWSLPSSIVSKGHLWAPREHPIVRKDIWV